MQVNCVCAQIMRTVLFGKCFCHHCQNKTVYFLLIVWCDRLNSKYAKFVSTTYELCIFGFFKFLVRTSYAYKNALPDKGFNEHLNILQTIQISKIFTYATFENLYLSVFERYKRLFV